MFDISCIICTHNPRRDYLDRTLESIRAQTLDQGRWELILVDNASKEPLSDSCDLSWHPNGRVIREDRVGLIHARLRSFVETKSPLIVFSDDDNELEPDYLEKAWRTYNTFPQLGAFGACIECEYEEPIEAPKAWIDVFRDPNGAKGTVWSSDAWHHRSNPIGAGLCIRREVANHYLQLAEEDPRRLKFGRTGKRLMAFEDTDIIHAACEMGLGKGILEELRLTHLIPARRTTKNYLLKLAEGHAFSEAMFLELKQNSKKPGGLSAVRGYFRYLLSIGFKRKMIAANRAGISAARREIALGQKRGNK